MDRSPSNVPLPSSSSSSASLLCLAISQTASAPGIDSPLSVLLQELPEDNPAETVSTDWNTKSRVKGSVIDVRESVRLLVPLSRRPLYNRSDAHPFHVSRKFHEQSRCREFRRHEPVQCCSIPAVVGERRGNAYSLLASSRLFTVSQFEGNNEYCKCRGWR